MRFSVRIPRGAQSTLRSHFNLAKPAPLIEAENRRGRSNHAHGPRTPRAALEAK